MNKIEMMNKRIFENLDKLIPFYVVGRLGSVSRAAQEIGLSQSALSHLISNLGCVFNLAERIEFTFRS